MAFMFETRTLINRPLRAGNRAAAGALLRVLAGLTKHFNPEQR